MNRFVIFAVLTMISLFSDAQTNMTNSQFENTKWEVIEPKDSKISRYWDFSRKNMVSYSCYAGRKSSGVEYSYYLGSSCSENFNHTKVGISSVGCYLYLYNNKLKTSSAWLIKAYDRSKGIISVTGSTSTSKHEVVVGGKSTDMRLRIVKQLPVSSTIQPRQQYHLLMHK